MNNELRIKATKILMNSDLKADKIADAHEAMCMTGAVEFLQRVKAICNAENDIDVIEGTAFLIIDYMMGMDNALSESDLVRKVMDYRLEDTQ